MSAEPIRRSMHFSGSVQGVGFRATTEMIARRHEVAGYVKNLPDGRVEVVAEGKPEEVSRFQADVEDRMSGYIRDTHVSDAPASGAYRRFEISY